MPKLLTLERKNPPQITAINVSNGSTAQSFETVLAVKSGCLDGIWIDHSHSKIYFTNMGITERSKDSYATSANNDDGSLECCNLDGTDHRVLLAPGTIVTPKQLVGDTNSGYLYFCDREGMKVYRCKFDGSGLEALVDRGTWPKDTPDINRQCVGIDIDLSENKVYWTQKGPQKGGQGRIFRTTIGPSSQDDIEELASQLPEPIDLHIHHGATKKLYWTDRGAPPNGNSLNVAEITEKGLENHQVIVTGFVEAIGLAVDPRETFAYVADLDGNIWFVDLKERSIKLITKQAPTTGITMV